MDEHCGSIRFDMLVEADAGSSLGHNRGERGFADLKRLAPQVIAVGNASTMSGNRSVRLLPGRL
jgi:hypothetical protein